MNSSLPLCVDMDGTLVKTDTMVETAMKAIKTSPWLIFVFPFWLVKGKAHLKEQLTTHATLNVSLLPYNQPFLTWLKEQKQSGRTLVLATASNKKTAQAVADHVGIFNEVIASDSEKNVSARHKAEVLVNRFGKKQFSYAGNAPADIPVWKEAGSAVVVNALKSIEKGAARQTTVEKIFSSQPLSFSIFTKTIRIHQWVKNLLLFVPVLAAHQVYNTSLIGYATAGAIAFCFLSSAIYIMNDLFDLESDRQHRSKKFRPIPAGDIPPITAISTALLFIIISVGISLLLPFTFKLALGAYVIINICYSSFIKQIALLDVITLSSLYVLRILAGGAATQIITSSWLFVFAMFFFTSLALVKRFSEVAAKGEKEVIAGRGYTREDKVLLGTLGISSGYLSILVLALYISSDTVLTLYRTPIILWLLIPLFLFWISRIWLLTYREKVHEDPIIFAIKDSVSYIVLVFTLVVVVISSI